MKKDIVIGIIVGIVLLIIASVAEYVFGLFGLFEVDDTQPPTFSIDNQVIEVMEYEDIVWTDYVYDIQDDKSDKFSRKEVSDTINYSVVGEYPVTIEVSDESGNNTRESIIVTVEDTIAPELEVIEMQIEVNEYQSIDLLQAVSKNYDNSGVTPELTIVENNIDYNVLGNYTYKIISTDALDNKTEKLVQIHVVDTTIPVVLFDSLLIESGTYTDYDWISLITLVQDNYYVASDCTIKFKSHDVVFDSPGNYKAKIDITDLSDNTSSIVISVTVEDTVAPTFDVDIPIIESGTDIDFLDYVLNVSDNSVETVKMSIENLDFDVSIPNDNYGIEICGKDLSGNKYCETFAVKVIDTTGPSLSVSIPEFEKGYFGLVNYKNFVTEISDNSSSTMFEIRVDSSQVDFNTTGSYQVKYIVTDDYNNITEVNFNLYIVESTLPNVGLVNLELNVEGFKPDISMFVYMDITEMDVFEIDSFYYNIKDDSGYIVVYAEDQIGNYNYVLYDISLSSEHILLSKRVQSLYTINSKSDFIDINNDLDGFYVLESSFGINDDDWEPIATDNVFTGVLYSKTGTNNVIYGLSTSQSYLGNLNYGLFDTLDGAVIYNVSLVNALVNFTYLNGYLNFGVLSGEAKNTIINEVSISNSNNSINGVGAVNYGTMIGLVTDSYVVNCKSEDWNIIITVGNLNIGSMIGSSYNSYYMNLENIVNMATNVSATGSSDQANMGGAIGKSNGDMIIHATVSGTIDLNFDYSVPASVGGIVGRLENSLITSSSSTATVEGSNYHNEINGGGLVGYILNSTVEKSYSTGNVSVTVATNNDANGGGLIGKVDSDSVVENVYAMGDVLCESNDGDGNTRCGGVVGYLIEAALNYAIGYGTVDSSSPDDYAFGGGVVGYTRDSDINYLLALGYVTVDGHNGTFMNGPDGYSGFVLGDMKGCTVSNLYSSSHQIQEAENDEQDSSVITRVTINNLTETWYSSTLSLNDAIWMIDEIHYFTLGTYISYPTIVTTIE